MPAPKENTNARKGEEDKTSFLHIRATPSDKSAWVKAAKASGTPKLAEWVTDTLNAAAMQELADD